MFQQMMVVATLTVALTASFPSGANAADEAGGTEHAHHHHPIDNPNPVTRSTVEITIPELELVRDDGRKVRLPVEIDDGRPVLLTFIYTSCTAICPVVTRTLTGFQDRLGAESRLLHMMSISIDPEQDTQARLREYAQQHEAGPQWQHYTGTSESSIAVQRAFNVYRGDKMNHTAVMFLRAAQGKPWVRLDGFLTPAELMGEYRTMIGSAR
jgi:protein SCO1/2